MHKITVLLLSLFLFAGLFYGQPSRDTIKDSGTKINRDSIGMNPVQIDTSNIINQIDTSKVNTTAADSLEAVIKEKSFSNFELFIYILITAAGLYLFFYIFVQILFRTFHKTRSTRQSLLLSWNLFFIISIIWIFILWGIAASLWSNAAFMTILIFLFIISLIMSIIAVKSK